MKKCVFIAFTLGVFSVCTFASVSVTSPGTAHPFNPPFTSLPREARRAPKVSRQWVFTRLPECCRTW